MRVYWSLTICSQAGGTVGKMIVEALVAQGQFLVTALNRPSSQKPLPEGLAAVKVVDQSKHDELVEAFQGHEVFIITIAPGLSLDVQKPLIDAAIQAGVKYIMPNEYGLDYTNKSLARDIFADPGIGIRRYIEEQGHGKTDWISLSCSFWYEFCLAGSEIRFGFDLGNKALTLIDDGNTKISVTTWRQCALAIAKLFSLPIDSEAGYTGAILTDWKNKPVFVSSFEVSQRDMFASILRVTNESESDWSITQEDSRKRYARGINLKESGDMSGIPLLVFTRVFFPNGGGDIGHKVDNAKLGLPSEDLDEATKEALKLHAGEFWQQRRAAIAARPK